MNQIEQKPTFTPSDLVGSINQTFDLAYGRLIIEGELANFRISKNKWVYFDLKDDYARVACFGTVFQLPGPLEDGMILRLTGEARLHPQFGFSVNVASIQPVGQGSIKRAADLLTLKLKKEGLFEPARKRSLPFAPERVALIAASDSAAYKDFLKILDERWGGIMIETTNVLVQGENAPTQLVRAIQYFNEQPSLAEVIIITRGGGSADDLAAFNNEHVVRAIVSSRIPTLVAIGHEVDISLAELAADLRASTPSNAAQLLVPDKSYIISQLQSMTGTIDSSITRYVQNQELSHSQSFMRIYQAVDSQLRELNNYLKQQGEIARLLSPVAALKRGYALIKKQGRILRSASAVRGGDALTLHLHDGTIDTVVRKTPS